MLCVKMKCPYCKSIKTKVVDKRDSLNNEVTRRRRECLFCHKRFTTYERIQTSEAVSKVKKRDGETVDFDKEKITTLFLMQLKQ